MAKQPRDIGASVRARLLTLAREKGQLSRNYDFDGERLSRAIAATFERRGTAIPGDLPDALTTVFSTDATKQRQWVAFARDLAAEVPSLEVIVVDLAGFLMPHARQALQRTSG